MAALILITVYCLITLDGTSTKATAKSVAYQLNFTKNDTQTPADTFLLQNTSTLPANQTIKHTVFVKDVSNTRHRTYHNFDTNNIVPGLVVVGERRDRRQAQAPTTPQVLPSQVLQLYPYPVFYPPNDDLPKYVEPYPRWNVVPPVFYPFPAPYPSAPYPPANPQPRPSENPPLPTKKPTVITDPPSSTPSNFYLPPAPSKPTPRPTSRPSTKPTPKMTMKPPTRPTPRPTLRPTPKPTNPPATKPATLPSQMPSRPTPRPTVYPPFYSSDYVQQKVDEYFEDNNINDETVPTLKTTVDYEDASPPEVPTKPPAPTDILDEDYNDEEGIRIQTTLRPASLSIDGDGFSSNRVPIFESPPSGSTNGILQIDARSGSGRNLENPKLPAAALIEKPKVLSTSNVLKMDGAKKGLCTWAILTCCNHNINSVRIGCFQIMGCSMKTSFPEEYDPCIRRTSTTENSLLASNSPK